MRLSWADMARTGRDLRFVRPEVPSLRTTSQASQEHNMQLLQ